MSDCAAASALLVAAGRGERLGASQPKALVPVAGRPMLAWAVDALHAAGVGEIVVALPVGIDPHEALAELPVGTIAVPGGRERSHSVRAALEASSGDPLIVHDAARPLVTPQLIERSVAALTADAGLAAAIAAAPVTDTIKRSADGRHAEQTLDRSQLWAVQTPQVFRRQWLQRALDAPDELVAAATDDASLVESLGGRVGLVGSDAGNFKVTTPHDLRVASLLLAERLR